MAVFNKLWDALGFQCTSVSPCLEAQLLMTASVHILMMKADVLGMTAAEMRAGPPGTRALNLSPFSSGRGAELPSVHEEDTGLDRKVIEAGTDARTWQQQG